jgi:hypothetical protein
MKNLLLTTAAMLCVAALCVVSFARAAERENDPRLGLNHLPPGAAFDRLAGETAAGWISMQPLAFWSQLEPEKGNYNFAPLDQAILRAQSLGMAPTVSLMPVSPWGTPEAWREMKERGRKLPFCDLPEGENLAAWRELCRRLAERYDHDGRNDLPGLKAPVNMWHLVQEWPTFFLGAAGGRAKAGEAVDRYARLLNATAAAIKSVHPQAKMILAGLASEQVRLFAFADGFIDDADAGIFHSERHSRRQLLSQPLFDAQRAAFGRLLRKCAADVDFIDVHLYEEKPEFLPGKLAWVRKQLGAAKPIINTEGGAPFLPPRGVHSVHGDPAFGYYDPLEGARDVVKIHVLGFLHGMARFQVGLAQTGGQGENTPIWDGPWTVMGLVDPQGEPRPAYGAYRFMSRLIAGFRSVKNVPLKNGTAALFDTPRGPLIVAWADQGEVKADFSSHFDSHDLRAATTPLGKERKVETVSGKVTIGATPVFIGAPRVIAFGGDGDHDGDKRDRKDDDRK